MPKRPYKNINQLSRSQQYRRFHSLMFTDSDESNFALSNSNLISNSLS